MSTYKRTPTRTAVVFGAVVFTGLMTGVGGYQAWKADVVGAVISGIEKEAEHYRAASPAGSGLPTCPDSPAQHPDRDFSSVSTWASRSPLGLDSVCY